MKPKEAIETLILTLPGEKVIVDAEPAANYDHPCARRTEEGFPMPSLNLGRSWRQPFNR